MRRFIGWMSVVCLGSAVSVAACGGGSIPGTEPSRATGQSGLMGKTFAGQNACNAKAHERPFIIEWDRSAQRRWAAACRRAKNSGWSTS
jgi:hypothetical protein